MEIDKALDDYSTDCNLTRYRVFFIGVNDMIRHKHNDYYVLVADRFKGFELT